LGITVIVFILTILIAAVLAYRSSVGVAVAVVFVVSITFIGKNTSWDPFVEFWYESYAGVPSSFADVQASDSISYDLQSLNAGARNLYEFRLAPHGLTFTHGLCESKTGSIMITSIPVTPATDTLVVLAADEVPNQALVEIGSPVGNGC
jgi:hypothetical protein